MTRINVVIIGFGYWGPNLARNIMLNSSYKLLAVVDQDEKQRDYAKSLLGVTTFASYEEIDCDRSELDLVVICTRPSSHKLLATYFIKKKINVLITKPCGTSSDEAFEIAHLADKEGVLALCDFTYHYSPLINFLLTNETANQVVKNMLEYTSYRTALGIVQADVDVIADLAVHDIYILLMLKSKLPATASCINPSNISNTNFAQIRAAFFTLTWEDGFTAAIHVSWNSPKKVRLISIASRDRAVLLEEMNREAPIQLVYFEPVSTNYSNLTPEEKITRNISYTMGNLEVPQIEMYEALSKEIEVVAKVLTNKVSASMVPNARDAEKIWKIVETLRRSYQLGGITQHVE
jgi:predicted dehydrogenase